MLFRSANLSNQLSPTNAELVQRQLGNRLALIVDGGQANVGIESTVVDLTATPARVLRPGMIHAESLAAVLGKVAEENNFTSPADGVPRSPGQLAKHYSPQARLLVLAWRDETDLQTQLTAHGVSAQRASVLAHSHIPLGGGFGAVAVIPHDAEAYAREIGRAHV